MDNDSVRKRNEWNNNLRILKSMKKLKRSDRFRRRVRGSRNNASLGSGSSSESVKDMSGLQPTIRTTNLDNNPNLSNISKADANISKTDANNSHIDDNNKTHNEVANNVPRGGLGLVANFRMDLIDSQLGDIEGKIDNLHYNVEWIKNTLTELKVLCEKKFTTTDINMEAIESWNDSDFKPIKQILKVDNLEKLNRLEKELEDAAFSTLFVEYLSRICGKSGTKDVRKIRYPIFDHLFDRRFITTCSWTGQSKIHNKKIQFSKYKNIIENLFKIFKLADKKFFRIDMKEICVAIFHNSTSRLNQEISKQKELEAQRNCFPTVVPKPEKD